MSLTLLNAASCRCAELLFDPTPLGEEAGGIHTMLMDSITACDLDVRKELLHNIVLSGGTTMIQGIAARWAVGPAACGRLCA